MNHWVLNEAVTDLLVRRTPVIIYGSYYFDAPPPWKRLAEDPHATRIREADPDRVVQRHHSKIPEKVEIRREWEETGHLPV